MNTKSLIKDYFEQSQNKIKETRYSWVGRFCHNHICLDLGCGDGLGTKILAANVKSIDGIDEHEENILFAYRNFYVNNKTRYIKSPIIEFCLKNALRKK